MTNHLASSNDMSLARECRSTFCGRERIPGELALQAKRAFVVPRLDQFVDVGSGGGEESTDILFWQVTCPNSSATWLLPGAGVPDATYREPVGNCAADHADDPDQGDEACNKCGSGFRHAEPQPAETGREEGGYREYHGNVGHRRVTKGVYVKDRGGRGARCRHEARPIARIALHVLRRS